MSRKILWVGLSLVLVAALLAVVQRPSWLEPKPASSGGGADQPAEPLVPAIRGKPAPDFSLPNMDGTTVRGADFTGKVLLVNFWATWCAPCLIEIPWFVEFQNQYGPQGFEVIGISLDEGDPEKVKKFVQEHEMNYTVVMGNEDAAQQFGGILGLPTTFLVDRTGKFYSMHRGLVSRNIVEEEVKALVGPPESAAPGPASLSGSASESQPREAAPPSSGAPAAPSPQKG